MDFTRLQPPHRFSFAALQRRHLLRLNLHSIQSFYLHPKKKDPEDPPQQLARPGGLNQTAPHCQGRDRALVRQTPPLMHKRGELVPPHHPPLPLPDAQPTVRKLLPKDFPAQHRICKPRRWWEMAVEGPPSSATAAPAAPQPPPGQKRRAGKGVGREPRWRTDQGGWLSHRAPGWRGRGVAAFVPGNLLPLRKKLKMRSERQGRPGLGKVRGGRGSPTRPISLNLTQKGDAKCTKFACGRWSATPLGSH